MPLVISILNIYGYEVKNISGRNPVIILSKSLAIGTATVER